MSFLSNVWKKVVRPVVGAMYPAFGLADAALSAAKARARQQAELGSMQQTWAPVVGAVAGAAGRALAPALIKRTLPILRGGGQVAKPRIGGQVIPRPASPGIGNRPMSRPMLGVDAPGGGKRKGTKTKGCCTPCKPKRTAAGKKRAPPKPKGKGISASELKAYRRVEPMLAKMATRSKFSSSSSATTKRTRS